jgi:hypothetical protein
MVVEFRATNDPDAAESRGIPRARQCRQKEIFTDGLKSDRV